MKVIQICFSCSMLRTDVFSSIRKKTGLLVYIYFDDNFVLGDDSCLYTQARDLF